LEIDYTAQNITDVATSNDVRVCQTATGQYAIHQFKVYTDFTAVLITCELQTNTATGYSIVYLQIYNRNTATWETINSNGSAAAGVDFILQANVPDVTNYIDGSNVISCRVYQLAV